MPFFVQASDRGSQRSSSQKPKDSSDPDDGGPPAPVDSIIARLIPELPPRLPEPSAPIPEVPKRQDIPDIDDESDDDGGRKVPSISTLGKIIPAERPRLLPLQGSGAPPVPPRLDESDDDDDGGVHPNQIAKKKHELDEKKKKKKKKEEEAKQKKKSAATTKPTSPGDEDEDGGVAVVQKKSKAEAVKKAKVQKPARHDDEEDDDDGGVSKQKEAAAKKKHEAARIKKEAAEAKKTKAKHDEVDDDDDDGAPVRKPSATPKKPKEKKPKPQILREEDEDEDGGRVAKSYDTLRTIMPTTKPSLGHATARVTSPDVADDDGSMLRSSAPPPPPPQPRMASYDTVGQIVPSVSTAIRSVTTKENHYDTIPTDAERLARANASYSPPSYDQASESSSLRSMSYREAAQRDALPPTRNRPSGSLSGASRSVINEDSSHYSEIINETAKSGAINRSYSHTSSIRSASNQSIKQQDKSALLKEQDDEEEEDTEDTSVESEEEEEEEEAVQAKPPRTLNMAPAHVSTAFSTIGHLVNPDASKIKEAERRRKQAKFRWYLAYTILNNYHLFDLRKQVQSRLTLLRVQRSNLIDEEQRTVASPSPPQRLATTASETSTGIRQRTKRTASSDQLITPAPRLLAVPTPVPIADDFPQSPAERYINIRATMMYDASIQQADTPRSPVVSQAGSTSTALSRSLGFQPQPTVRFQPPSDTSTARSDGTRPAYERQASNQPTCVIRVDSAGTPVFNPVPESISSLAEYPLTNTSVLSNSSTLRTQMSHAQHMQAWHQRQANKIHKKRPHCYQYGSPPQRPMEEKVATAAILTPQIVTSGPTGGVSPFQFPRGGQTNPMKTKTTEPKKSLRTTSALTHQRDSRSNLSSVTEV